MNRHIVLLFMGKDMASIAGAISTHVTKHSSDGTKKYIHFFTFLKNEENNIYEIKEVNKSCPKQQITDDATGRAYFKKLHPKIINIDNPGDCASLYLCAYIQLYDTKQLDCLKVLAQWIKGSGCKYEVDVCGISYDLAELLCTTPEEKRQLIYKDDANKESAKQAIDCIAGNYREQKLVSRFFLMENQNTKGIGLNLDKNTFIRILGEFAILTSEHYFALFPPNDINNPEINIFGISALWFNSDFYRDCLIERSLLAIFDREGLNDNQQKNPSQVVKLAKDFIQTVKKQCTELTTSVNNASSDENVILQQFQAAVEQKAFNDDLQDRLTKSNLSLEEKRLLYAILLMEDDELMNDGYQIQQYQSFDECYKPLLKLYIEENNKIIDEEKGSKLRGPKDDNGHIYNPIDKLYELKKGIRTAKSDIRKWENQLKEIQEARHLDDESRKVIVDGKFVHGADKFRLLDNVEEKPLEETYHPSGKTNITSIDLREKFSPIKNQGGAGSCTAFAASSIFEYILNYHNVNNDSTSSLSPRFLYYNVCKKNNDGTPIDNGSSYYDIMHSLEDKGICTEDLCPYDLRAFSEAPSDEANNDAKTRLVTKAMNVNICHNDIVSALAEGYPVAIALKLFDSFEQPNSSGFIFRPTDEELAGGDNGWHAMVICGFSDQQKVYIVRNSWGEKFGDKGYCYIPFSYIEDKELCRQACVITEVNSQEFTSPTIIKKDVNFDLHDKNAESAALKVLIGEESYRKKHLEDSYHGLKKQYINLLADLTSTDKRDALRDHATAMLKENTTTPQQDHHQEERKSIWPPAIAAIGMLVALILYSTGTISGVISCVIAMIAMIPIIRVIAQLYLPKEKKTTNVPAAAPSGPSKLDLDLKFRKYGILFEHLKGIQDEIQKKHRLLTSYILNLKERNKELKDQGSAPSDDLKPPFITILSKDDCDKVFKQYGNQYTGNIDLWNLFCNDYKNVSTDEIITIKNKLEKDVSDRVEKSYQDFSMCDFIMQPNKYPAFCADGKKVSGYIQQIENCSLPFTQLCPDVQNKPLQLLFVQCTDINKQKQFDTFSNNNFQTQPQCVFGGVGYKLTYVQIDGCKKTNLRIFQKSAT